LLCGGRRDRPWRSYSIPSGCRSRRALLAGGKRCVLEPCRTQAAEGRCENSVSAIELLRVRPGMTRAAGTPPVLSGRAGAGGAPRGFGAIGSLSGRHRRRRSHNVGTGRHI
jgi:hypothetical protein